MSSIAIIGAGISGLSCGDLLQRKHDVVIFEQNNYPGGLIHCTNEDGILYHRVGGHVFNSKVPHVLNWFWTHFKESEFNKVNRNAKICLQDNSIINYPIENYLYQLDEKLSEQIIDELLELNKKEVLETDNFEDFLKMRFGQTLYDFYFKPYNTKIWDFDLSQIPLDWLQGKLPMPHINDIFKMNVLRKGEVQMVHSTFYYPKIGGSQFLADRLSEGLPIIYETPILTFQRKKNKWIIGEKAFDAVIYTGDVRDLPGSLPENMLPYALQTKLVTLESHGTTTALCEVDSTDLSWLYFPDNTRKAHRIIYTGNFSPNNNGDRARPTATIEVSGFYPEDDFKAEIKKLPGSPSIITYNYHPASYVIHTKETRDIISSVKNILKQQGFYLLGRMAEWEYYNMDAAIDAAMQLTEKIK